jgi:flavin reductase (DIM6/NTAB) family NADH-FMN oxidoreductase RutF
MRACELSASQKDSTSRVFALLRVPHPPLRGPFSQEWEKGTEERRVVYCGFQGSAWQSRNDESKLMFYTVAKADHGLAHDPIKALVAPRPIGWISAMSQKGEVNLSPYSFFNMFSSHPPIVGFSSEGRKDALTFAEETGEFVCNLATRHFAEQLNKTSTPLPRGVSEFDLAGLGSEPSCLVKPPRVQGVAGALECKWLRSIPLAGLDGVETGATLVLGQVVGVYIDDQFLKGGKVNTAAMYLIQRAGYDEYFTATPDTLFSLKRP